MKRFLLIPTITILLLAGCRSNQNETTPEQDAASLITTAAAATVQAMGITLEPDSQDKPTQTASSTTAATETPGFLAQAIVESANLNLREGPGTFFQIIKGYPQGTAVTTLEMTHDGSWIKVAAPDGAQGWMAAQFLDLTAMQAALPITAWPETQTIFGTVLDRNGNPINAARIVAVTETDLGELRSETTSTTEGQFYIYMPPGLKGPFDLEIVALNCGSTITITLADGSCGAVDYFPLAWRETVSLPQTEPVRFTYEKGAAFLEGKVVYQDGNGASQILVRAIRYADGAQSEFVTPQGGEFRLPLGIGYWEVVAVRFLSDGTPLSSEIYSYQVSLNGQEFQPLIIPYIEIIER